MKQGLFWAFLFISHLFYAQKLEDHFENKSLRVDYVFAVSDGKPKAFLDGITALTKWQGRHTQLTTTPIQGDGQIRVYNQNQKLIYVEPFSSLFQEWLSIESSQKQAKSFENSFFIPFPKDKVTVKLVGFDAFSQEQLLIEHTIDPSDLLIRQASAPHKKTHTILHSSTLPHPIRIAIIAEGYSSKEQKKFLKQAKQVVHEFFSYKIFKDYQNHFEFIAVPLVSPESGVSIPSKHIWKKSALQSHFDTFYSERYLTIPAIKNMHQQLENFPYQHVVVLANTNTYGGGGILNSFTITTTETKNFARVVVHEIGHSIFGLADEYFYPTDALTLPQTPQSEPWQQNITSLSRFDTKWSNLLDPQTPIPTPENVKNTYPLGVYEGLPGNGYYKPSHSCRMLDNTSPDFCKVCNRAIEEMILFYTSNES